MARPSDALLRWLRNLLKERGISAAALAERAGLPRPRVRHVLAGDEPMTVDELLAIGKVLDVSPSDLAAVEEDPPATKMPLAVAGAEALKPDEPEEEELSLDPLGNQPKQLFQVAFLLGVDFLFLATVDELKDSGVPRPTLERYTGRELPIKLDAAYHAYNQPKYDDEGVTLTLSFDALYDCRFPWTAIKQVVFFPQPPSKSSPRPEPEPEPAAPKKPFLRLVE